MLQMDMRRFIMRMIYFVLFISLTCLCVFLCNAALINMFLGNQGTCETAYFYPYQVNVILFVL